MALSLAVGPGRDRPSAQQLSIRLRHLHQSRSAQRAYKHEALKSSRVTGVAPLLLTLPLARGGFFALSCCCPAGAHALLLFALAVSLVSWPLAWMLQLAVPPGWCWLVSWPMLARFVHVPRAVFGLSPRQQRLGWPQVRRRARPQVPAVDAVLTP